MAQKFDLLIKAKTAGEAGIKRMGNSMQGLQGRLKNVRMAALSVNTAFRAMAVILTAGALTRVIKGSIDQADAFGKLSRQTGIAADQLQAYVNAGKLAGVEQGTIDKGLRRLAQSMREADQGVATYEDAYKALGVTVRDSEGNLKESEVVLGQLADRFRDMPDGATKAALAMEIFGRSGAQLIPMLNEGGDALERWNYETSEGFAANAEYFNDQLTMIGFGFDGFRKQLADAVLPALNAIMEAFRRLFESGNDWQGFFNFIEGGLRSISFLLMSTVVLMEEMIALGGAIGTRFEKFIGGDFKGMDESAEKYRKGFLERFKRNQETFGKIVSGSSEAGEDYYKQGTQKAKELEAQLTRTFGGSMKAKIQNFSKTVGDLGSNVGDVVIKAFKGMEDQLVNFVMNGKMAFRDLTRSILADMARIAIQKTIMEPVTGWFGNLFSSKGNVLENGKHLKKYAKGGVIDSPHFKYMANGGVAVAGEAGAEAILPLRRRNGVLGVEGGGSTVVNIAVDATGSSVEGQEMESRQLGQVLALAIQTELVRQKRPGGLLA